MCVIAICKDRHLSPDEVRSCWTNNPQGAGIAWASRGKVHVIKGLMRLEDLEGVLRERRQLPYIVHFRLTSVGPTCPELTHPFPVLPEVPLDLEWTGAAPALAHNGHVGDWRGRYLQMFPLIAEALRERGLPARVPSGPWSDTRAIAAIAAAVGEEIIDFLDPGKVAMIWPDGKVRVWGLFVPARGVLFSNYSYVEGHGKRTWNSYGVWDFPSRDRDRGRDRDKDRDPDSGLWPR